MRLRSLLLLAGVLALGFGLGFLFMPRADARALRHCRPIHPSSSSRASSAPPWSSSAWCSTSFATWVTCRTQRGVVIGSFLGSVAGLVVALTGQFWGVTNQFGWSTVAIYGLLTLGYGSFMFGDRSTPP